METGYRSIGTYELMRQALTWQVERIAEQQRTACLEELENRADCNEVFSEILRSTLASASSVLEWEENNTVSVLELAGAAECIPALELSAELLAQAILKLLPPTSTPIVQRTDAFVQLCDQIPFADEYTKYTNAVCEAKKIALRTIFVQENSMLEERCAQLEQRATANEQELNDLRASAGGSREQLDALQRELADKKEEIEVLTTALEEHDKRAAAQARELSGMHDEMREIANSYTAVTYTNMIPEPPKPARQPYTNMVPSEPRPAPRVYTNMIPNEPKPERQPYTNMVPNEPKPERQPFTNMKPEPPKPVREPFTNMQPPVIPPDAPTKRRYPKPSDFRRFMEDPLNGDSKRKRRSRDFLDEADKAIDRQKRAGAKKKS